MDAISCAAPVLVRRAAERLHRFDIGAAAGRLHLAPASDERRYYDLVNATTRRRLLLALDIARGAEKAWSNRTGLNRDSLSDAT